MTPAQGIRVLRSYEDQYPSLDLLTTLFNQILAQEGAEAATQLIKDELSRNPTLLGLDKLLEAQLMAAPAERRHDLELVKNLVGQHIKRLGMYRCEHCGFRAKQYYWRCPGCAKWETYSPRTDRNAGWLRVMHGRSPLPNLALSDVGSRRDERARTARDRRARLSRHDERVRRSPLASTRRLRASRSARSCSPSPKPGLVRELVRRGFRVFLDLKFHDIPNTVAQACAAATRLGVWMIDVHAAGGAAMLSAARDAVADTAAAEGRPRPLLVAVTVLTSLDAADLAAIGVAGTPEAQALRLARARTVQRPRRRRVLRAGGRGPARPMR